MIAVYTYKQIKDRLLKYKEEYEKELDIAYANLLLLKNDGKDVSYINGHIQMISMLLDDLDSESGIAWLGADFAEYEPKPHERKMCEGNCEECIFANKAKEYYLTRDESVFDSKSDYDEFIEHCKRINGVDKVK